MNMKAKKYALDGKWKTGKHRGKRDENETTKNYKKTVSIKRKTSKQTTTSQKEHPIPYKCVDGRKKIKNCFE